MKRFYERMAAETSTARDDLMSAPFIQYALQGDLSRSQYVAFLTQAYHHVKHTVPLLMSLGSRLPAAHGWLQQAVVEYVEEEVGHDEWILSDIEACGADANAVRHGTPAHATELMVAYAYHQIDRQNPIGFFGMVHVLEGTSVAAATDAASALQKSLGLPDRAFTYLNSHGNLDQEHVKFFETLMNRIEDPNDQAAIIHCAQRFYRLYGDIFRSLPMPSQQQSKARHAA
jgi:pyrroloquinoline quinone (PQQ) biosynthesis protein C